MSKRNLILLIIFLTVVLALFFGFLYKNRPKTVTEKPPEGTNFVSTFNPFGTTTPSTNSGSTPPANTSGDNTQTAKEMAPAKLQKISSMPVAGFSVFQRQRAKDTTTEFAPMVRYVARETGNIYETFGDKIVEGQFTTTIIPKVYEASFADAGDSVLMRYLKDDGRTIETFLATLPKEIMGVAVTTNNQIKGSFLPENISDVSISPDNSKIFYLTDLGGSSSGVTSDTLGNKKAQVFDSPFTEWLSQWPNASMIALTTKPSAGLPGYMYAVNPNKKDFNKILGGVDGLTTLTSPNAKQVLYGDSSLSLKVFHTDTKSSDLLGIRTLPEKCVWGTTSDTIYCAVPRTTGGVSYPDDWYKGKISFSDQIWKIDINTGSTTMLVDPGEALGQEVDGVKLALDQGENYLFFIDKKDSFLWKLQLK